MLVTCLENVVTCTKVIRIYKVYLVSAQLRITFRPKPNQGTRTNLSLYIYMVIIYDDAISMKYLDHDTHIGITEAPRLELIKELLGVIRKWNYFRLLRHGSRKA